MSTKPLNTDQDYRENDHISEDDVIELACELAHEELVKYWAIFHASLPMETVESDSTEYNELAQDKFNDIYDEIESVIVELMKLHPNKNIVGIAEILRETKKETT